MRKPGDREWLTPCPVCKMAAGTDCIPTDYDTHWETGYAHDARPTPKVVQEIRRAFPKEAEGILAELQYSSVMGCWHFQRWGMFIGVEEDGYIHS